MSADFGTALAWSGGKDSMLALIALPRRPRALLTTVDAASGRVTMHGVPGELVRRQAASLGLPLVEVSLPEPCPDLVYARRIAQAFADPALRGVGAVAFGDVFLEDVRAYREQRLAQAGRQGLFPLWGRDSRELAREFIARGFRAIVVCVDTEALDPSFAGRAYDQAFLADLPAGVDPCGERGEFHTFVHHGPGLVIPLAVRAGPVELDGRFARAALAPS